MLVGIGANKDPAGFKVKGSMQLYSIARKVSQPIEGHAAAFSTFKQDGAPQPSKLFSFAVRTATGAKVSRVQVNERDLTQALTTTNTLSSPAPHR